MSKKIKCNICWEEDIKAPVFTPCFHSYCSECMSMWLNEKKDELVIPCPVCKHNIAELAGYRDPDTLFHPVAPPELPQPRFFNILDLLG